LFFFNTAPCLFFAALDNALFYMDKTMMVFSDAKKAIEGMVKAVDELNA
jgi:NAD/NADP transhydrogenase beta subunit